MSKLHGRFLGDYSAITWVILFLILAFSFFREVPPVHAQSTDATLSGTVVDQNGATVAGATVTISNPSTGFTREATTNSEGIYTFPSLAPGSYIVTARSAGFAATEVKDVALNVNDRRSLQIQLQIGQVGETVTVNEESASLINESPAVATTVNRQFVENLPLNGRSFQALINLTPGVVVTPTDVTDQGQFSVNGQRASSNAFYVDGVSANFGGASGANLYGFAGGSLPALSAQGGTNNLVSVDALQEFTIQTSSYAAEFGRQPGAQISIASRPGTNNFTGALFEYLRNDALDANDWFNNSIGALKPPLRQNQFGGVFGGPVLLPRFGEGGAQPGYDGRNRTFFFFSYEGLRLRQPVTRLTDVPSLAARTAAPPSIRPFLNAYPLPNGPVNPLDPNTAQFNTSFSDPSDLNTYGIRIDHTLSPKLQLFGRFNNATSSAVQRAAPGDGLSASSLEATDFKTRTLTFGATSSLSNTLINEFRFNYSTHKVISTVELDSFGGAVPVSTSAFFASAPLSFTGANALFAFLNLTGRQASLFIGKNTNNTQRQINVVDSLVAIRGNHNLKFGADYRRLAPLFDPRNYVGAGAYFDFTAAVLNLPFVNITQQSVTGAFYFTNIGAYAQDTWKISPRLTLNYGLRWDLDLPPTLGGGLQPLTVTSAGFTDPAKFALAPTGTLLWRKRYDNFGPRIGVAYKLRDKAGAETILRGGFGVFYDLASQQAGQIAQVNYPPFGASNQPLGPGVCLALGIPLSVCPFIAAFPLPPDQAAPPSLGIHPPLNFVTLINPDLKSPYTYQFNAAVEQSLGVNQTITASYVGAVGRRLLQQQALSGLFGIFNSPFLIDNTATSDYHALQAQFQRRLSRGLQALASYTWSHSIDIGSSVGLGSNSNLLSSTADRRANRGPSDFDIRHSFTAAVSYSIPAPFRNRAARAILGGWSTDNIFTARTAAPLSIFASGLSEPLSNVTVRASLVSGVPVYLSGPQFPGGKAINPAAFTRPPVNAMGFAAGQGSSGRNAFRGFGAYQLDFGLRREFNLKESVKLQFRAELFNILNHPNFGAINNFLGFNPVTGLPNPSPTFGQATSTLGQSLGTGGLGGGFSPLYQIGGPRSTQLSLKLQF